MPRCAAYLVSRPLSYSSTGISIGGGQLEQLTRLREIDLATLAALEHERQVVLRVFVAGSRRQRVEALRERERRIGFGARALEAPRTRVQRIAVALLGRLLEQCIVPRGVTFAALATLAHDRQVVLGRAVALLGGARHPLDGLERVLGPAEALEPHLGEVLLRHRDAALGERQKDAPRLGQVGSTPESDAIREGLQILQQPIEFDRGRRSALGTSAIDAVLLLTIMIGLLLILIIVVIVLVVVLVVAAFLLLLVRLLASSCDRRFVDGCELEHSRHGVGDEVLCTLLVAHGAPALAQRHGELVLR